MKLTKSKLQKIIKEEILRILSEAPPPRRLRPLPVRTSVSAPTPSSPESRSAPPQKADKAQSTTFTSGDEGLDDWIKSILKKYGGGRMPATRIWGEGLNKPSEKVSENWGRFVRIPQGTLIVEDLRGNMRKKKSGEEILGFLVGVDVGSLYLVERPNKPEIHISGSRKIPKAKANPSWAKILADFLNSDPKRAKEWVNS